MPIDLLEHHVVEPALAKAGVKEASGKGTPALVIDPELPAGGVVEILGHPDDGLVKGLWRDDLGVVDAAAVRIELISRT